MMVEHFFFTLVPAGILLVIGRRINFPATEAAARRAFIFLLGVLVLLLAAVSLMGTACCPEPQYFLMLAATGLIPVVLLQWGRVRSPQMTILLLGGTVIAVVLGLRYALSGPGYGFVPLLMVGGSLLATVIWQGSQARGGWAVLGGMIVVLMLGLVLVQLFLPNSLLLNWPEEAQRWLNLVALVMWPGIAPILIGVIALHLITASPYRMGRIAAGLVAVTVIVSLTIMEYREVWILDVANDNLGIAFFQMLPALGAGVMALLLIWTGHWRTLAAYALLLAASVIVANMMLYPMGTKPTQVIEQRAAQIDTAIQTYYDDNAAYPDDLLALTPRYLLTLPNPVLFQQQTWCYDGGSDFYRFGYVHRPAFGVPNEFITIKLAGEAGTFPAESWVCDAQLAAYHERYRNIGVPGGSN